MNKHISPQKSFEVEKSISFLIEKYNQSGKNTKPVILHSIRVGMVLIEFDYDIDVIVAGILHDLLEDTDVSFQEIEKNFSLEIARIVGAVSYNPKIEDPVTRYKEMFERIVAEGQKAIVIKAADMIINIPYIRLVPDSKNQKKLLNKALYFIKLNSSFSSTPIFKKLQETYNEECERLSKK
jgi:guanosine-3',5'-bis(diphosphate) 3'-pyrophosphohydrolase